jgi:phosphatidylglycerol---prolipoprotein diacylglyceryl transferase
MKPIFFELSLPLLGRVSFPAYMTMLVVGFTVAILVARRDGERAGIPGDRMIDLGLLMLVLGIAGARLLAVLTDGELHNFIHLCTDPTQVSVDRWTVSYCASDQQCGYDYLCDLERNKCYPPRDCLAALKFWQGGLTFYGGFFAALAGGVWYARRKQLPVARVADVAAPAIMLGLFFGRLGCFFNGCCYGAETDAWVGVTLATAPGQTVHPTQLYEAAVALGLFAALRWAIAPRARAAGEVFGWLLALYGVLRFAIEFLRADPRGALGPLSTSQLLSIPIVAAGVWLIARARRRGANKVADTGPAQYP